MTKNALLLATLATKQDEVDYLTQCLAYHDVNVRCLDVSLAAGGRTLDGAEKSAAMQASVERVWAEVAAAVEDDIHAIVGIGGGTGGEIILSVLRALPITFPKVLVTTLPFDPRIALADNSIIIMPTLADITGLNATLREVLENTSAMVSGLCSTQRKGDACIRVPSVGVTALGATEAAVKPLIAGLKERGEEPTVFHSNGYGGAAFTRFAERGAFHTVIDLTPHELTRIEVAGAHVDMPARFSAASDRPRIVLPGGLNFIGLGKKSLVPSRYLDRPHYAHSGFFTHVKVDEDEMVHLAKTLAGHLNALTALCSLIIPLGGFSHQDRADGPIEDIELRHVFADVIREALKPDVAVTCLNEHISAPAITSKILETYDDYKRIN